MSADRRRLYLFEGMLGLALASALLLPSMLLREDWPFIELSDLLLLPLVGMVAVYYRLQVMAVLYNYRKLLLPFGLFTVLVLASILVNGRVAQMRDWFELLKYMKFIAYVVFFLMVLPTAWNRKLTRFILALLALLMLFNTAHYIDFLGFNRWVEPFYAPPHHLDLFGLNSLGQPDTRRALGTMGNPNVNALMFLLFLVLLLSFVPVLRSSPGKMKGDWNPQLIWPVLAIFGVFMCQSRTAFVAYILVMTSYFVVCRSPLRVVVFYALVSAFAFGFFAFLGNAYLSTIADPDRLGRASIGRITQWLKIIDSMPGHWILGHAPSKEYFEKHSIYSESEYFLLLFRYGLGGLAAWVLFWGRAALVLFRKNAISLLFFVVIGLAAITNNPLHAVKLNIFIAFVLAVNIKLAPHE